MTSLVDRAREAGCDSWDAEGVVDTMAEALEVEASRLAIIERGEDAAAFIKVAKWMRANK